MEKHAIARWAESASLAEIENKLVQLEETRVLLREPDVIRDARIIANILREELIARREADAVSR